MADVIPFAKKPAPRSYDAVLKRVQTTGRQFTMAGTLDGFIDFAIEDDNGNSRTHILTCDEALLLVAALNAVVSDIGKNCLFDADPLLVPT